MTEQRFQLFTTLIANINRSVKKIKTEEMSEFNLKSVHVSCIYYLYRSGALTVKELCDICDEDKANISRSLEYLEEIGYINPRPSGSKRYKAPLELTKEGERIGEMINSKVDKILIGASEGISEQDRAIMYKSLETICTNLRKVCDGYDC